MPLCTRASEAPAFGRAVFWVCYIPFHNAGLVQVSRDRAGGARRLSLSPSAVPLRSYHEVNVHRVAVTLHPLSYVTDTCALRGCSRWLQMKMLSLVKVK